MASCTNSRSLLPLLLLLGACSTLQHLVGEQQDPAHYEALADAAAQQLFDAAMVHVQAGRDAAAVPLLQQLVQRRPEFVRGHLSYQDAARRVGGAELEQMRDYYRTLPDHGSSVVPAYAKARQQESTSTHMQALKEILRRDNSFYYAHLSLARLLRSIGRLSDAVDSFRHALSYNGELLAAHLELAETLVEWGKYSEAQSHYENYLRGAPTDLVAARAYVQLLVYRLGRPREALPWIQQLLDRDAADDAAWMDRAAAMWRDDQPAQALAIYLAVLERRPDHARALLNVAFLYFGPLAPDDTTKQRVWVKAAKAFLLYQHFVRPEEGMDYFEHYVAVPFRVKSINDFLRARQMQTVDESSKPTLADLK